MTIMNRPSTEVEVTIQKMRNSEFEFYLTGSQFFGGSNITSDWDFYVGDVSGIREWLQDRGFTLDSGKYDYNDKQVIEVWKMSFSPIDIQIVRNVDTKTIAQEIMRILPPRSHHKYHSSQMERAFLWNQAYRIAEKLLDSR